MDRFLSLVKMFLMLGFVVVAFAGAPGVGLAQSKSDVVYAAAELNLRKGPGSGDAIIGIVPLGAELQRAPGQTTNEYAPVTYDGRTGWVVALGVVAAPAEVGSAARSVAAPVAAPATSAPVTTAPSLYSTNTRYTLMPLMLRAGPDMTAESLAGMPEGSLVTLTREGAQNGYVTVDYGGLQGWAYADLLGVEQPVA
jgi:uncharacterized protein YraI